MLVGKRTKQNRSREGDIFLHGPVLHGLSKDAASSETLFAKNLPLDTTSEGAQVIFGQYGKARPKSSAKSPELEDSGVWAADGTADAAGEEHQWANVQDEVEYFLSAHEVDVNGATMLRRADPDVQQAVMDQGDLSFANNQTAALISRIRAHGGKGLKGRGKGQQASAADVPGGVEQLQLVEKVKEFQKLSEESKQSWWSWIAERGYGGKKDPSVYEKELLWEFLEHVEETFDFPLLVGIAVGKPAPPNTAAVLHETAIDLGGGETAHLSHAGSNWVGGGASASKLTWRPKLHASAE